MIFSANRLRIGNKSYKYLGYIPIYLVMEIMELLTTPAYGRNEWSEWVWN